MTDDYPEAPCRICGARVKKGTGVHMPDETLSTRLGLRHSERVALRETDPWVRQHSTCQSSWSWVMLKVTGIVMSDEEAYELSVAADVEPVAMLRKQAAKRRPFDYLTAEDRSDLLVAWWRDVRPRRHPTARDEGACGWCGVREATGWTESELTWADGSVAPLCGKCGDAWQAAGLPRDIDEQRYVAQSLLTGVPRSWGGRHSGMRLYLDLAGADHSGHDRAWDYSPGLRKVKFAAWESWPEMAPEGIQRDIALKKRAIKEARQLADELSQLEAARPGADIQW